jgi:hypothetical protein
LENLIGRDYLGEADINGVLKYILKCKIYGRAWTGFIWLRIEINGSIL